MKSRRQIKLRGTKLPATLIEHDALEYARQRIAFFHNNLVAAWHMTDIRLFGPDVAEVTRRRVINALTFLASQAQTVETVVDDARAGWDCAQEALKELILEFKHHNQPMPPALAGYDYSLTAKTIRPPISGEKP